MGQGRREGAKGETLGVALCCWANTAFQMNLVLPLKHQKLRAKWHSITSHTTLTYISAVRTWNLTRSCLLNNAVKCQWCMNGWVWSNGGMIMTGENWSTGRKILYSMGGRWMNEYGAMVEWYWQGKTEVLWEKHYTAWVVDEWIWSNGGMILTGENGSPGRKTLYSMGGRWMNEYGAMEEWYWQEETEILGEKHYTAWVVDEWMIMEQWWKDTDREKLKYWWQKCPSTILSTTNSAWTGPGLEDGSLWWEASDSSTESWQKK